MSFGGRTQDSYVNCQNMAGNFIMVLKVDRGPPGAAAPTLLYLSPPSSQNLPYKRSKKKASLASLNELSERMPTLLDVDHPCAQRQIADARNVIEVCFLINFFVRMTFFISDTFSF